MKIVVVREYARLTTDPVEATLDQATVTPSAFEWLCNLAAGFSKGGASLLHLENRRWLRLDSYVGVVETPCGTLLEILPKHTPVSNEDIAAKSRALLIKMLAEALDLPVRTTEKTDITTFRHPLLEWVMKQFVLSLDHLIKRGLRFDYQRVEEEQHFLRGQLDVVKQMRQPPGRAHIFNIRHDLFLLERPENRLLKTALMRVCRTTNQPQTWRLAHELAGLLADMPDSTDTQRDFRVWSNERLMAHYQPVRPWCELVLGQHMPLTVRGATHGISLLFPMEKLFERYVETRLRKQLPSPYSLKAQARSASLCRHNGADMFQLRPDFLVREGCKNIFAMDAKWKLISGAYGENKYGLSQADFYQLFAYGHKYLDGTGKMLLIFPLTAEFPEALPAFDFSPALKLWVVPFDLETDRMTWPNELKMAWHTP
ncbi:McrC family protein [Collimonas pratensis]|uniref:McrBC 5-methylcytosine restriction system component family protein n=1 Tax=Collimonas pratensis TaxID=279113 RepID=A0ABM5YZW7_9BURK|nr:McrC family protein [Collimonas pratensis]AMP12305.1 mcrBC 5-methylcytosine restriction system component family protein [Collimonas pratensis]